MSNVRKSTTVQLRTIRDMNAQFDDDADNLRIAIRDLKARAGEIVETTTTSSSETSSDNQSDDAAECSRQTCCAATYAHHAMRQEMGRDHGTGQRVAEVFNKWRRQNESMRQELEMYQDRHRKDQHRLQKRKSEVKRLRTENKELGNLLCECEETNNELRHQLMDAMADQVELEKIKDMVDAVDGHKEKKNVSLKPRPTETIEPRSKTSANTALNTLTSNHHERLAVLEEELSKKQMREDDSRRESQGHPDPLNVVLNSDHEERIAMLERELNKMQMREIADQRQSRARPDPATSESDEHLETTDPPCTCSPDPPINHVVQKWRNYVRKEAARSSDARHDSYYLRKATLHAADSQGVTRNKRAQARWRNAILEKRSTKARSPRQRPRRREARYDMG